MKDVGRSIKCKSWFEQHLNWTMVLGWLLSSCFMGLGVALATLVSAVAGIVLVWIGFIGYFAVTSWALRQMNRSLWFLALLLLPLGWIILFLLDNKSPWTEEDETGYQAEFNIK